jgi:hypothetical protein
MSVKDITSLIQPPPKPTHVPKRPNWDTTERKLGLKLPTDYKGFIAKFGSGLFANFIRVFNPFHKDPYISLLDTAKTICDMYRDFKESEGEKVLPFALYPEEQGLLPWGNDENGNYIFWLTKGNASKWPTVVAEGRGPLWQRFDFPMTTFLAKILTKQIRCKIWPTSFPSKKRSFTFTPYD